MLRYSHKRLAEKQTDIFPPSMFYDINTEASRNEHKKRIGLEIYQEFAGY